MTTRSDRIRRGLRRVGISLAGCSLLIGSFGAFVTISDYFSPPTVWCAATSSLEAIHVSSDLNAEHARLMALCPRSAADMALGIGDDISQKQIRGAIERHQGLPYQALIPIGFSSAAAALLWGLCETLSWIIRGFMLD